MSEPAVPKPLTSDERAAVLGRAVVKEVSSGRRVESQTNLQAVLVKGKRPSHVLHLLLTIITVGVWGLFVWLPLMIFARERRVILTVDEHGNVQRQKA